MNEERKSGYEEEDISGNSEKYHSYREAWKRINVAIQEDFYLEAVTIEESIICDRLISHLVGVGIKARQSDLRDYGSFGNLLNSWHQNGSHPVEQGDFNDLQKAVDNWRDERNYVVHGIVKSHPGDPTDPVIDFLGRAKQAAEDGKELARAIDNWHKRMK